MGKFLSTGLLAATGAAAGAGQALGDVAKQYTERVNKMDLATLTHQYEMEKVRLADELAGAQSEKQRAFEAEQNQVKGGFDIVAHAMQGQTQRDVTGMTTKSQESIATEKGGIAKYIAEMTNTTDKDRIQKTYDLGLKQIEQSQNEAQLRAGVELTLRGMVEAGMTDRQITEHAQNIQMENKKYHHQMQQIIKQETMRRHTIRMEWGFRDKMNRDDITSKENIAQAERTLNRELGQLRAGTDLTRTGMVVEAEKVIAGIKAGAAGDSKFNEKLTAALLVSMNDIQEKINKAKENGEDYAPLTKLLQQREALFQQHTGVSMGGARVKDYDTLDKGPAQTPAAKAAESPGMLEGIEEAIPSLPRGESMIEQRRKGATAPPAEFGLPRGRPQPPMIRRGMMDEDNRIP